MGQGSNGFLGRTTGTMGRGGADEADAEADAETDAVAGGLVAGATSVGWVAGGSGARGALALALLVARLVGVAVELGFTASSLATSATVTRYQSIEASG